MYFLLTLLVEIDTRLQMHVHICIYYFSFLHQFKIKQKDSKIKEFKKLLSDKQETVSQLEQDLSNSRLKLSEREEEELSKENQALSRQLEEVKQGNDKLIYSSF